MDRRQFNKTLGSAMAVGWLGTYGVARGKVLPRALPERFDEIDHFHITHQIRDGRRFPVPKPSMHKDIVVVGGGISGLTALYRLSDYDCLLLDKEPEVGGTSRRRSLHGIQYPLGAVLSQGPIEPFTGFFDELGVEFKAVASPKLGYYAGGSVTRDPLGAGAGELPFDANTREAFAGLKAVMAPYLDSEDGIYFPYMNNPAAIRRLDDITLWRFYEQQGFPPELRQFLDHVVSSRLGCNGESVSALVGVYLLSRFTQPAYTLPGGHGEVVDKLRRALGDKAQRFVNTGVTVTRVENRDDGRVWVSAVDDNGEAFTVSADTVVMATPKLITKLVVAGLDESRQRALREFEYNAYLVAQVTLKEPVSPVFELVSRDLFSRFMLRPDWIDNNGGDDGRSHLTVYIPFPGRDGRMSLYTASAEEYAQRIYDDIGAVFGEWGQRQVDRIILHRWGHPMVVPRPGMEPVLTAARAPLGNIVFAHSDTFGVSGLYSAVWTGMDAYSEALLNFVE